MQVRREELDALAGRVEELENTIWALAAIQKRLDDMQHKLFVGRESIMGMCKTIRSARRGRIRAN